jgi:anti-sigma factor RsiW
MVRSIVCERVRAQVSLRVDDELSQLESRMVDAHLARCETCREFEASVLRLTERLRSAPLEPIPAPVVVRRIGRTWLSRAQVSMAAAVAVAALGITTQLVDRKSEPAFANPVRFDSSVRLEREVKQIIADGRAFADHSGTNTPL